MRYRHPLTIADADLLEEGRREMDAHGHVSVRRIADRRALNIRTLRDRIAALAASGAWTFPTRSRAKSGQPTSPMINTNDRIHGASPAAIRAELIWSLACRMLVREGAAGAPLRSEAAVSSKLALAESLYQPDPSDELNAGEGGGRSWSGVGLGRFAEERPKRKPDFARWRREYRRARRRIRGIDYDRLKRRSDAMREILPDGPSEALAESRGRFRAKLGRYSDWVEAMKEYGDAGHPGL